MRLPLHDVLEPLTAAPLWQPLVPRLDKLSEIRGATADWLSISP